MAGTSQYSTPPNAATALRREAAASRLSSSLVDAPRSLFRIGIRVHKLGAFGRAKALAFLPRALVFDE